jgi:hypothetical protein
MHSGPAPSGTNLKTTMISRFTVSTMNAMNLLRCRRSG